MTLGIGSISSSITKGSGLGKTCTSAVRWPHLRTAWKGVYARSISFLECYRNSDMTHIQEILKDSNSVISSIDSKTKLDYL